MLSALSNVSIMILQYICSCFSFGYLWWINVNMFYTPVQLIVSWPWELFDCFLHCKSEQMYVKLALFRGKSIFKAHLIFLVLFSKRGLTSEPFNLKSQAFAQVRAMPFNIPVDNFNETYMVSRAEVRYIKISHRNDINWSAEDIL